MRSANQPKTNALNDGGWDPKSTASRDRLLQAAGEVFADHGYRLATVREICRRAKANVASVNYHFGDKEQLYLEVLRYAGTVAAEKYPTTSVLQKAADPEDQLKNFIKVFMHRILDVGCPSWHGKVMVREMSEPSPALDILVRESMRPLFDEISVIVTKLLGRNTSTHVVEQCTLSILGQCTLYCHSRAVIERLEIKALTKDVEAIASHIATFSIHAIHGISKRNSKHS